MDRQLPTEPLDRRVGGLARRQHGVVERSQLIALGLSRDAIEGRVKRGLLHPVHRGVYAFGHLALTRNGRFMAATLACGEGTALSHFSAAVLWGLLEDRGQKIHVTAERQRKCRGVVVHQAPLQGERLRRHGIVATTPARTLVDLADVVTRRRTLERAFDEAEFLRLDWQGAVPRHGRRGSALLASVLARHTPGSTRTLSDLEEMFLALCDDYGFPRPEVNCRIEGYLCDFVWRDQRLIVETDGGAAHGTRRARERDPIRDAELQLAGWMVMRIPYMRLLKEPDAVAAQVGRALKPAPAAPASPHPP
jgi:very-short-patch-repair endonuclease